ncbi:SpoIIE family protein phosphatase [Noviherbaspirillum sp.]|uniref:SpoIIE family protein phosphatase n=1 Tax=Noviherbaspirillum sp. TaxID=1926288 RepID=UPI002B48D05C|nr:SpoIIE family protein phosphatase [Noviherbaspirillum sp.]HJV80836.1 SpoIIE family protein phosphatase [Noviherbaspirillum sp.]
MITSGSMPFLQYWVAARPMPGERESGDQYVIAPHAQGVLIAVVDGLGHGEDASIAAKAAVSTLAEHADEPLAVLMQRCHQELRKTRGAVLTAASINAADNTLSWVAVGNVEGMLLRAAPDAKPISILPRGGIIGDRLPALLPASLPICAGDFLLFATDGICSAFLHGLRHVEQPQQLVNQIFYAHARDTDDALVLGVLWTGESKDSTVVRN